MALSHDHDFAHRVSRRSLEAQPVDPLGNPDPVPIHAVPQDGVPAVRSRPIHQPDPLPAGDVADAEPDMLGPRDPVDHDRVYRAWIGSDPEQLGCGRVRRRGPIDRGILGIETRELHLMSQDRSVSVI